MHQVIIPLLDRKAAWWMLVTTKDEVTGLVVLSLSIHAWSLSQGAPTGPGDIEEASMRPGQISRTSLRATRPVISSSHESYLPIDLLAHRAIARGVSHCQDEVSLCQIPESVQCIGVLHAAGLPCRLRSDVTVEDVGPEGSCET